MKILLSLCTLFLTISLTAQVVDEKVEKQTDILRQARVDTFLVYSLSCNGGLIPLDTCAYEQTQYLFWTQNSTTFLKRFDYCNDYQPIQIDSLNPLAFYFINKLRITNEKIKQPTYYEIKKTKRGFDTLMNTIMVDHSCYHQFEFVIKKTTVKKTIDNFDLYYIKFDNGKKNINYSYNQQTKQKKLIDIVTKLIDKLTHEKKFVVE